MIENTKTVNIEFRCPQCFKLYRSDIRDIHSAQPQFECVVCHAQFTFDYPPKNPSAIYTRALALPQISKLAKAQKPERVLRNLRMGSELKSCPKCETLNPRGASECYKCGVVFAKAEAMANDKAGGLPSLIRMWQDLIHDYSNLTKHMAFIDRCEELHALPFALKKYKELKDVQPHDSLAQQMLNSVVLKSISRQARGVVDHPWLRFLREIPWGNLARLSPLVLCLLLAVVGSISRENRNFAGGGIALGVLILGAIYVRKGRIEWQDFWR